MNKREAHVYALRLAYEGLQKYLDCGPSEKSDLSHEDEVKVEQALEKLAQAAFDRWDKAARRRL